VTNHVKIVVLVVCLFTTACVSLPADQTSYAGYVGDRATISLSEVVVSVQSPSVPFSNLHVGLAAIINPSDFSYSEAYDVERIVRRMEPRISSRVVQTILATKAVTPGALPSLRDRILAEAQSSFDAAFAKWEHAPAWNVELAVTSLYFTNGSVGRGTAGSGRWW